MKDEYTHRVSFVLLLALYTVDIMFTIHVMAVRAAIVEHRLVQFERSIPCHLGHHRAQEYMRSQAFSRKSTYYHSTPSSYS